MKSMVYTVFTLALLQGPVSLADSPSTTTQVTLGTDRGGAPTDGTDRGGKSSAGNSSTSGVVVEASSQSQIAAMLCEHFGVGC